MDPMLSYDFAEIEHTIRRQIHLTSARFNAALDDLRTQIAPLQQTWTRMRPTRTASSRTAGSVRGRAQRHPVQSGTAVRDGADDVAATDRTGRQRLGRPEQPRYCSLCGPREEDDRGSHSTDSARLASGVMADTEERRVGNAKTTNGRSTTRPSPSTLRTVHERFIAGEVGAEDLAARWKVQSPRRAGSAASPPGRPRLPRRPARRGRHRDRPAA